MGSADRGRILVVEDHDLMARVTQDTLEAMGYAVTVERDAARVTEVAESLRPDLAIVDVQMPPFELFHAITLLAGLDEEVRPAIVALSGHAEPYVAEEARRRGADAFLPKPWDRNELAATIERLVVAG